MATVTRDIILDASEICILENCTKVNCNLIQPVECKVKKLTHKQSEMEWSNTATKSSNSHNLVEKEVLSLKYETCWLETKHPLFLDENMQDKHIIKLCEHCEF